MLTNFAIFGAKFAKISTSQVWKKKKKKKKKKVYKKKKKSFFLKKNFIFKF